MLQQLVSDLRSVADERPLDSHTELVFRILFGLPSEVEIQLVVDSLSRFLSVFQTRWPHVRWPSMILKDPVHWVKLHSRDRAELANLDRLADATYSYAFDALLNAVSYASDRGCVASSCSIALTQLRMAFALELWEGDDPQGVQLWRENKVVIGRRLLDNDRSRSIARQEWRFLISRLESEEIAEKFQPENEADVSAYLNRWRETSEYLLVSPFP